MGMGLSSSGLLFLLCPQRQKYECRWAWGAGRGGAGWRCTSTHVVPRWKSSAGLQWPRHVSCVGAWVVLWPTLRVAIVPLIAVLSDCDGCIAYRCSACRWSQMAHRQGICQATIKEQSNRKAAIALT